LANLYQIRSVCQREINENLLPALRGAADTGRAGQDPEKTCVPAVGMLNVRGIEFRVGLKMAYLMPSS
jgi:hypothetical protein